ncbi:MAG: extracellular solute-binding protein [Acidobacteriota bacterium]
MRNLNLISSLAIAALLLPAAAAFGQTEILIWHAYRGGEKDAFEEVVARFNDKMKGDGVAAKTLAVPYDAFADKITAAVPRGKGPDIFIYAQDRLGGWVEAGGAIEPIDFFLDEEIEERFIPSTLAAMTYQDTVYGLPLNFKVITQFYNKQLISKAPQTSSELVSVTKKLTDQAAGKFGLAYAYSDFYYHAALMNGFGGGVFDTGRKPTMNLPQNIKAMELLMRWYDQDKILPAEPSVALITNLFNEGKAAIVFSGPWFLGEIKDGVDFGLAPLPTLDESGKPMAPWMTVEGAYITPSSKHQDEAFEFVSFLTDLEAAKILALKGGQTPANQAVYDDPDIKADEVLQAFRAQVENAVPMPNYAEMSMMWTPATTAMNLVVKKTTSPKAALDNAQKELTERIANLRN